MRSSTLLFVFGSTVLATPSLVHAQDDATADRDEVRAEAQFREATIALEEGRFAEAVEGFSTSLDLFPQLSTAFNLAVALRGVGRTRAAVELFDELLGGRYGEFDDEWLAAAQRLRSEAAAEISQLRITIRGADSAELRINGVTAGRLRLGEPTLRQVDAGTHVLAGLAPGRTTQDIAVTVERGREERVELHFTEVEDEEEGSVVPWILIGAGIAAVAATIVVILVIGGQDDPEFENGDVFGITFT